MEYTELIKKTSQTPEQLQKIINSLQTEDMSTMECCLGLIGEAIEFIEILQNEQYAISFINRMDFIEELGDFYWYFVKFCLLHNYEVSKLECIYIKIYMFEQERLKGVRKEDLKYATNEILIGVGKLSEGLKKQLIYQRKIDLSKVHTQIENIMYSFIKIMMLTNVVFNDVIIINQKKLLKRYPEGFERSK